MNQLARILVPLATLLTVAGCAGPGNSAKDDGEYEWVRPTGSNIAVKVKKGQSAGVATSPTATVSGDQAGQIFNSAGGKVPTDTGGR